MKFIYIAFTTAASVLTAHAATISWASSPYTVNGTYGQYPDTGLFDTTGTQILAENVGGPDVTFDGIDFSAGTIVFAGVFNQFHDPNLAETVLSRHGTYGNSGPSTVTLSGFTVGEAYRIQALVYDGRGTVGIPGRTVEFDGIDQGTYANGVQNSTWGDGLLVTGTFVADATTQDFAIEAFADSTSKGGQLNAVLVHQIPEPSAALLGGLGALALLRRRRLG